MVRLSEEQINEIASTLDCGLSCFIDRKTGKVNNVLNIQNWEIPAEISIETILNEPGVKWYNYIEIRPMTAKEAFKIMELFIGTVTDMEIRDKLNSCLKNKHPFKNFKWTVDRSDEYRQKWLDFKSIEYISWVKNYLDKLYLTEN